MSSAARVRIALGAARSLFSQVLPWLGALRWLVSLVAHGSVRSAQAWPQRCALSLALCVGGSRCRSARRRLVAVCAAFDPDAHVYPDTSAALGRLEAALDAEMPPWAPRKRGRGKTDRAGQARSLPNKVTYLRRVVQNLRAQLKHVRAHRVASAFVCKVALSSLLSSATAFAEALRDLIGDGLCSRRTMSRIRDAFAGVVVEMSNVRLAQAVVAATSAGVAESAAEPCVGTTQCAGGPLFVAAVLHIHDEASLRLRSRAATDTTGVPVRSRGSKVNSTWSGSLSRASSVYTCQWSCTPWRVRPLLCWRHRCAR